MIRLTSGDEENENNKMYEMSSKFEKYSEFSANTSKNHLDTIYGLKYPKLEAYEKAYYLSTLCLKCEKYEDAIRYADEMVISKEGEFYEEEINLLIGAYKSFVSQQRQAWKATYKLESGEQNMKLIFNEMKKSYEEVILNICQRLISLINNHIINKTKSDSSLALLLKVKADHYRYMAEISHSQALYNNKQNAFQLYKRAYEVSSKLEDLNPIKLGVALNYSVFLYEILNKRIMAIFYAKDAIARALIFLKEIPEDEIEDEKMKESLNIIQIIDDNIHEWYKEELEQNDLEEIENEESVDIQAN